MRWLAENRCPWCTHDGKCKGYKTAETQEGYRCFGYRSKFNDERWDVGANG